MGYHWRLFPTVTNCLWSKFWKALHKLSGIRLAMSSSFHPRTDGSSECSNKTINQAIRYHVNRQQHGWVKALPRIRFSIMNTVNTSTGFSGFQLRMGCSPRMIPPLIPEALAPSITKEDLSAAQIIEMILSDTEAAKDNLIQAKVLQATYANHHRRQDFVSV